MKVFQRTALLLLISKIEFLFEWQSQILGRWKSRSKLEKNYHQGQLFQFCPGRIEDPILHILDPNYPSFDLKCPIKCQKT